MTNRPEDVTVRLVNNASITMTIELPNPCELSTRELLAEIIRHTVLEEQELRFFVPRGEGRALMQRVRMELSRSRKRNERKGRKNLRFTINQSIYPWTDHQTGERRDRVLVNSTRTQTHEQLELLDDLIAKQKGIELS